MSERPVSAAADVRAPYVGECLHSSDGELTWNDRYGEGFRTPAHASRSTCEARRPKTFTNQVVRAI
jgi:hypothetical protein